MHIPTPQDQLIFLDNLQVLLDEGSFSSSYKYALLLSLAEISIENGQNNGEVLEINTKQIAKKFIDIYWKQTIPYPVISGYGEVLFQNTGRQAAVITKLTVAHETHGGSIAKLKRENIDYNHLVSEIARIIQDMPLWKLQTIGGQNNLFLYEHTNHGNTITLLPGISYCFRHFYGHIEKMVQGAWVQRLRTWRGNQQILGQITDLQSFLFDTDRTSLTKYTSILKDFQDSKCFYCNQRIHGSGAVDHFIPWAKYPVDLGHNFVLAHPSCNNAKRDYLASYRHLSNWISRNKQHTRELSQLFDTETLPHDLVTTHKIAKWAYGWHSKQNRTYWDSGKNLVALDSLWKSLF